MEMLLGKTRCWNSVIFNVNGTIAMTFMINGIRKSIVYDSIDDVIASGQIFSSKSSKWVVGIPDSDCIFKEIALPAINLDEASRMLEYELYGLVPVDPQGLVSACYEMSHEDGSYNLCVCVIKKSLLEKYYDDLRRIEIVPDRVLVHSLAIKEACMGVENCTVLSANNKAVLMTRFTPSQMPTSRFLDLDTESGSLDNIAGCLENANSGEKLLFALPGDMDIRLREIVNGQGIKDWENIAGDISDFLGDDSDFLSALISKGAVKICKNEKFVYFNLMHSQELKSRAKKKTVLSYTINSSILVFLVLLLWFNLWLGNIRLAKNIKIIDGQIEPIKDVATQVEAKKMQLRAIDYQINSKGKIIRILDDFYGHTPESISLNEINIENQAKGLFVQIKGQTQDHASAFGYTQDLKEADYINGLIIGVGHSIPRAEGKSIVEFSGECFLSEVGNGK